MQNRVISQVSMFMMPMKTTRNRNHQNIESRKGLNFRETHDSPTLSNPRKLMRTDQYVKLNRGFGRELTNW